MAKNLNQRISALEQKASPKLVHQAFRIICKGDTPTPVERQQIDDATARGEFVICRLIMSPFNHALN